VLAVMLTPLSAVKHYADPRVLASAVARHAKLSAITGQASALPDDPASV